MANDPMPEQEPDAPQAEPIHRLLNTSPKKRPTQDAGKNSRHQTKQQQAELIERKGPV